MPLQADEMSLQSSIAHRFPAHVVMNMVEQQDRVHIGALRIDRSGFEVRVGEHELKPTRKEFELLWVLASEAGRTFRRDQLVERVWGPNFFIDPRTVDAHIARLRKKLKGVRGKPPAITTVWGIGYRLTPAVNG